MTPVFMRFSRVTLIRRTFRSYCGGGKENKTPVGQDEAPGETEVYVGKGTSEFRSSGKPNPRENTERKIIERIGRE